MIDQVLQFFYTILEMCVEFLLEDNFGMGFGVGYIFIAIFVVGVVIRNIILRAR